jgi:3-hydroxy-3-methylglutaryl CoA synthase
MGKEVNVGIVGVGIYIPENVMTAAQISEATLGVWSEQAVIDKLGIVQKTMRVMRMELRKWVPKQPWIV